jgi:hypothetical protein
MKSRPSKLGYEPKARLWSSVSAKRKTMAGLTEANAAEVINAMQPGEHWLGLTRGQMSMIDLIIACLRRTGPARVTLWTWVVADYELAACDAMMAQGDITGLRLVVDRGCLTHRPGFIEDVIARFGADAVRATHTHAKVAMVRGAGLHWLLRGSANLNNNARFEQVDVSEGAEWCDWFEAINDEIWRDLPRVTVEDQSMHYGSREAAARVGRGSAPAASLMDGL